MKTNKYYSILCGLLVMLVAFSSCKKESESTYDIFKDLKIDFKEALASDEVYVEFNLKKAESGASMAKVIVTENGTTGPVYSADIAYANRYAYSSGVLILKTGDPSTVSYDITVFDENGNDITSTVTVSYPAGKQVTSDATLVTDQETETFEEGKTVYIDYTVTSSDKNIKYIWLESFATGTTEPSRVTIATLPDNIADAKSYRGAYRVSLNRDGGSKFRIYVTDEANDYIGDGYTSINTDVETGYELAANKFIYAPKFEATVDSPDVTSACFYSISKKKTYTYEKATQNSEDIDFGIYLTKSSTSNAYFLNLYNPLDVTNPVSKMYSVSSWTTKRATKYSSALPTDAATVFNTTLVSGASINKQGTLYSVITNKNRVANIAIGTIMYFKTPEGKYGAIFFNGFGKDYQGRYYANIDVKIEK